MFVVNGWLLAASCYNRCVLFIAPVDCHVFVVVCCCRALFAVRLLLLVVRGLALCAVRCVLFVVSCLLCCSLFAVGCDLVFLVCC